MSSISGIAFGSNVFLLCSPLILPSELSAVGMPAIVAIDTILSRLLSLSDISSIFFFAYFNRVKIYWINIGMNSTNGTELLDTYWALFCLVGRLSRTWSFVCIVYCAQVKTIMHRTKRQNQRIWHFHIHVSACVGCSIFIHSTLRTHTYTQAIQSEA